MKKIFLIGFALLFVGCSNQPTVTQKKAALAQKEVVIKKPIAETNVEQEALKLEKARIELERERMMTEKAKLELEQKKKELVSDSFQKDTECAKSTNTIQTKLSTSPSIYRQLDPVVEKVFYSPSRNACIYQFRHMESPNDDVFRKTTTLVDFSTGRALLSLPFDYSEQEWDEWQELLERLNAI